MMKKESTHLQVSNLIFKFMCEKFHTLFFLNYFILIFLLHFHDFLLQNQNLTKSPF